MSKRIQEKQFEPIEHFISVKAELTEGTVKEFGEVYITLVAEVEEKMNRFVEHIEKKARSEEAR